MFRTTRTFVLSTLIVTSPIFNDVFAESPDKDPQLTRDVQKQIESIEREIATLKELLSRLTGEYTPTDWKDFGVAGTAVDSTEFEGKNQSSRYRGGVRIDTIILNSTAHKLKLAVGDVIVGYNNTTVATVEELIAAFKQDQSEKSRSPKMYLVRDGSTFYVDAKQR